MIWYFGHEVHGIFASQPGIELTTPALESKILTTGLFRYDLNKIPNDYTVELRNRLKVLDLIDRVPDELWMEVHNIV